MGATGDGVPCPKQPQQAREAAPAAGAQRQDQHAASAMNLPPGFRFHPTDEELSIHYLGPKALDPDFTAAAMGDVDLNKYEPWELRGQVKMVGGTQQNPEMYMFNQRDRKYPTGTRTNRATARGYWKATGKDKVIYTKLGNKRLVVGMKKTLVFYTGRAPRGVKTNWVMHEYRLDMAGGNPDRSYWADIINKKGDSAKLQDQWVVCRVFLKPKTANKRPVSTGEERVDADADTDDVSEDHSAGEPSADEPPPLAEPSYTDYGTGATVQYAAAEDTVGGTADSKQPRGITLPPHTGSVSATSLNTIQSDYGRPTFSFLNDTQNNLMMVARAGTILGSGHYNNPFPNTIPSSSPFSLPPLGPTNPLLHFGDNDVDNLVFDFNPLNNLGDAFNTGPLHQQDISLPIRMIPTPQTPAQCKEEELPVLPTPLEMFSPDSANVRGAARGSFTSPGCSSFQQMTTSGDGFVYQDHDDLFPPGVMMNMPDSWS